MTRPTPRERVAALLRTQGFTISASDIRCATGYWRTSRHADVYRWDARCKAGAVSHLPHDIDVRIVCWDTLTDCARHGINLYQDSRDLPTDFMVEALKGKSI